VPSYCQCPDIPSPHIDSIARNPRPHLLLPVSSLSCISDCLLPNIRVPKLFVCLNFFHSSKSLKVHIHHIRCNTQTYDHKSSKSKHANSGKTNRVLSKIKASEAHLISSRCTFERERPDVGRLKSENQSRIGSRTPCQCRTKPSPCLNANAFFHEAGEV